MKRQIKTAGIQKVEINIIPPKTSVQVIEGGQIGPQQIVYTTYKAPLPQLRGKFMHQKKILTSSIRFLNLMGSVKTVRRRNTKGMICVHMPQQSQLSGMSVRTNQPYTNSQYTGQTSACSTKANSNIPSFDNFPTDWTPITARKQYSHTISQAWQDVYFQNTDISELNTKNHAYPRLIPTSAITSNVLLIFYYIAQQWKNPIQNYFYSLRVQKVELLEPIFASYPHESVLKIKPFCIILIECIEFFDNKSVVKNGRKHHFIDI